MRTQSRTVWCVTMVLAATMALAAGTRAADTSQFIRSTRGSGNLYEKLIVRSSSAFYVQEPTISAKRIAVPAFSIFYRLKTGAANNERDGYYRIGKRSGEPVGWIKKELVKPWNTRFGLEPVLPQPDRNFTIYGDPDARKAYMRFVGQEGMIPDGAKRLALIVDVPSIESADEIYPVVVFTGQVASGGARQQEQMALYNLELEVVFVIASTASMEHLIEVARHVADQTAQALRQLPEVRGIVHFGLVEYRDAPPYGDFAARVRCKLNEGYDTFQSTLQKLEYSSKGDDDWPDDVVAGLATALNDAGWRSNSSKHIILLGDCPAKDGYDPVFEKEQTSVTGKSLAEIAADARPQGGSDSERALAARNFHAVCNNHESEIDQFLNSEEIKSLPKEKKEDIRGLVEDAELVKLVRDNPAAVATAMVSQGMPKEAAVLLVELMIGNDSRARWQKRAQSQFQTLASNRQELDGYYAAIDSYRSPKQREQVIEGLTAALNKAFRALIQAREGKTPDTANLRAADGAIGRALYQLVGTKGDAKNLEQVEQGYASVRDENGRLVAHKCVMAFKEELMHLYSTLDWLHTTFKNKSNKADRQNVSDILDLLKRAVASRAAGQEFGEDTELTQVIQFDFPLRTPALEISAKQLAVMTTPAFDNWLESLGTARDRAKSLVLEGHDWTTLNKEDRDQFTFLRLSELP